MTNASIFGNVILSSINILTLFESLFYDFAATCGQSYIKLAFLKWNLFKFEKKIQCNGWRLI